MQNANQSAAFDRNFNDSTTDVKYRIRIVIKNQLLSYSIEVWY
jgi:hypothetical protein